eukprot:800650-Pyramimonas_sp.AAC.1
MPGNSEYAGRQNPLRQREDVCADVCVSIMPGGRSGEVNDGRVASGAPGPGPPQRRVRARWS